MESTIRRAALDRARRRGLRSSGAPFPARDLAALAALAAASVASHAPAQQARLTLQQVFGAPATALSISFDNVDAACLSTPVPGVTCAPDAATQGAAPPIVLRTGLSGGSVSIARSLGVLVVPAAAAGVWSTPSSTA